MTEVVAVGGGSAQHIGRVDAGVLRGLSVLLNKELVLGFGTL